MSEPPSSLQDALELQRAAIAGEIHDSLMPYLFATKMRLESLVAKVSIEPLICTEVTKAVETLQDAMTISRQLIGELYPTDFAEVSWADHLTACLERVGGKGDAALDIQGDFDKLVFNPEQRLAGRRIAQEAVRNAVRHGRATAVLVSVKAQAEHHVELSISDNGKGFDSAVASRGYGLRIMQSRANAIGAALTIESKLGGPTRIVLTVDHE